MTKICPDCHADILSTSQPNRMGTTPPVGDERADLIRRLHQHDGHLGLLVEEAADALEAALAASPAVGRGREALKPFAFIADQYDASERQRDRALKDEGSPPGPHAADSHRVSVTLGDCRNARAALATVPAVGGETLEPVDNTIVNCARFVKWVLQEGPWQGIDLDGGGVQDKAESFGLIVSVPYDPEKHGAYNDCGCDAGDPWFEFSPALNAAAQAASPLRGRYPTVDAIRQTIADEWGSHLCYRDSFGVRSCRQDAMDLALGCRCDDIAKAILSTHSFASPPEQPAAEPVTAWQPVETIPKDGLIDVWTVGWGAEPHRVADCYYDQICGEWRTTRPAGQILCIKERYVTHWRPCPAAPEKETA